MAVPFGHFTCLDQARINLHGDASNSSHLSAFRSFSSSLTSWTQYQCPISFVLALPSCPQRGPFDPQSRRTAGPNTSTAMILFRILRSALSQKGSVPCLPCWSLKVRNFNFHWHCLQAWLLPAMMFDANPRRTKEEGEEEPLPRLKAMSFQTFQPSNLQPLQGEGRIVCLATLSFRFWGVLQNLICAIPFYTMLSYPIIYYAILCPSEVVLKFDSNESS